MFLIGSIIFWTMAAVVGYFSLIPLKAAAEYRFRGKLGLTVEGIGFAVCLLAAITMGTGGFAGYALLGAGIAAGAAIRSRSDNDQRYLE
ncbi:hypothetical protein PPO43_11740 [Saprospira sp. CCB-QB6]|uniref:hypothetical protein n=1 Tax=Saprospira sp. CCB-QB6 TaxID=3023936 RepID=UPI00234B28D8|nr:hypothetical protein [Saprospira sp. CCB-QB6]WCL80641.1 hypothetical protein PPO43_11740 [Saprospira sp. CCB-QB6]